MSGDGNTRYTLDFVGETGEARELLFFRLHKSVKDIDSWIDQEGKSSGNGYDWRDLQDDIKPFSRENPSILILVKESGTFDGESYKMRHFFKAGKVATLSPTVRVVWPEFSEDLLD